MRVAKMPYLQLLDGVFQVQIVVPPKLQTHLPSPHTGKASLTKALATGNKAEANRLAVRWIADFQAILNEAEAALRGEDGWKRYTYYPGPYAGSFGATTRPSDQSVRGRNCSRRWTSIKSQNRWRTR
jgi:hypothetical protein